MDTTVTTTEKILIFDGDCGFCSVWAHWIERRWKRTPTPRIIPWQTSAQELPGLVTPTIPEMRASVWWLDADTSYAGARAIAHALMSASSPWRHMGRAMTWVPSWISEAAYRVVARNRHRLPGSSDACRVDSRY